MFYGITKGDKPFHAVGPLPQVVNSYGCVPVDSEDSSAAVRQHEGGQAGGGLNGEGGKVETREGVF